MKSDSDGFKRWKIPLIGKGAVGPRGGHFYLLGFRYTWTLNEYIGWADDHRFSLFGLVAIEYQDDHQGRRRSVYKPGWSRPTFGRPIIGWRPPK